MSQDAYDLINASISFFSKDDRWQTQLYGKNLTDEAYTNAGQDFSPAGVTLTINEPRIFGIKIIYQYR